MPQQTPAEHALALWQYHSQMMWNRIQTISVIEAGVLVAWYKVGGEKGIELKVYPSILMVATLLAGALLLYFIHILMRRDGQYIQLCIERAGDLLPMPDDSGTGRRIAKRTPLAIAAANICLAIFTIVLAAYDR